MTSGVTSGTIFQGIRPGVSFKTGDFASESCWGYQRSTSSSIMCTALTQASRSFCLSPDAKCRTRFRIQPPRAFLRPNRAATPPLHFFLRTVHDPAVHLPTCSERGPASDLLLFVSRQHPPPPAFTPPKCARSHRAYRPSFRARPSTAFSRLVRDHLRAPTSSSRAWPWGTFGSYPPIPVQPLCGTTSPPRKTPRCTPNHGFVRGRGEFSPPAWCCARNYRELDAPHPRFVRGPAAQ